MENPHPRRGSGHPSSQHETQNADVVLKDPTEKPVRQKHFGHNLRVENAAQKVDVQGSFFRHKPRSGIDEKHHRSESGDERRGDL